MADSSGPAPDVNYIKHSQQSARTACSDCGKKTLYWAHEQVGSQPDTSSATYCTRCKASGSLILVDNETYKPHSCTASPTAKPSGDGGGLSTTEQELAAWEKELASEKPKPDPWQPSGADDATQDPMTAEAIEAALKAISEGNAADMAANELELNSIEPTEIHEGGRPKPFPDDEEFVKHSELNEFDPLSYEEAALEFLRLSNGIDSAANMSIRNGGRLAQLALQMLELERRTRTTITIVDEVNNTSYDLEGLHHYQLGDTIKMLMVEHVLLVGGAGAGKGEIAYQAAEALKLPFYTLDQGSLSPQTPVSAIIGYMNSSGKYIGTTFRQAFEHGGLIFLDELDNAHPACLATINAALAIREGQLLGFPGGKMVKRHKDFRVLAAANTFGRGPDRTYAARQRGDAATWDRFSILGLKYDETLEDALCAKTGLEEELRSRIIKYVRSLRANVRQHNLPVVIGMRASIGMCRLMSAGLDADQAIDARCRRGASDADWAKISQGTHFLPEDVRPAWNKPSLPSRPSPFTPASKPLGQNRPASDDAVSGSLSKTASGDYTGYYNVKEGTDADGTEGYRGVAVEASIVKLCINDNRLIAIKRLRMENAGLSLLSAKNIADAIYEDYQAIFGSS